MIKCNTRNVAVLIKVNADYFAAAPDAYLYFVYSFSCHRTVLDLWEGVFMNDFNTVTGYRT